MRRIKSFFVFSAILFSLQLVVTQTTFAAGAMLSWDPPTTNMDGTPAVDLAGYKLYWGTSPGVYTNVVTAPICINCPVPVAGATERACVALAPGDTYYFALTAYDTDGNESDYSNEVSKAIPSVSSLAGNIDATSPGSASRVDGYDLTYVLKCFGSAIPLSCTEAGFATWAANSCNAADLSSDAKIDNADVTGVTSNFGASQ